MKTKSKSTKKQPPIVTTVSEVVARIPAKDFDEAEQIANKLRKMSADVSIVLNVGISVQQGKEVLARLAQFEPRKKARK